MNYVNRCIALLARATRLGTQLNDIPSNELDRVGPDLLVLLAELGCNILDWANLCSDLLEDKRVLERQLAEVLGIDIPSSDGAEDDQ